MPSCLVNQCLSKSGRKGQSEYIILHKFPNELPRIKSWLAQTGQRFEDLEVLANKVLESAQKKEKNYFLCSNHFTVDSYRITHYGRALKQDAVPSIFPLVEEGESIIEESLRKDRTKSKKRRLENEPQFHVAFYSKVQAETEYVKPGMASESTQTEYNLTNSEVTFTSKKPSAIVYERTARISDDIFEVKIKSEIKEEEEEDENDV
ncbi:THAP domain-containing protein 5-like [Bufo gargarizans]|uniref:THAP domain-containing protein 5-like n=1 Tax=Bufo gargarizans TaxID=30331 RepID=UPI001CF1142C|nr:THAP domain-containing protein 5-like [Bufo gargarizans]